MLRILAMVLACLSGPVMAGEIEVATARGPATVETHPETVAVYDVAALDTLVALGVKPAGVIANVYVDYLDDIVADASVIGTLFEPDFEALHALQPDLIIAGGRSAAQVAAFAGFAPTIDMTIWEDTIGEAFARLNAYGLVFGKEQQAAEIKAALEDKLAATQAALVDKGRALIVLTNGPKVSAYGASGRFGWLHAALGLPEAVEQVEQATHGEAISFEFIRDANPDILIVLDRLAAIGQPGANAAATLDNPLVHETAAWKNGKVIYLNAADVYVATGGVQSLNRTLDLFLEAFAKG